MHLLAAGAGARALLLAVLVLLPHTPPVGVRLAWAAGFSTPAPTPQSTLACSTNLFGTSSGLCSCSSYIEGPQSAGANMAELITSQFEDSGPIVQVDCSMSGFTAIPPLPNTTRVLNFFGNALTALTAETAGELPASLEYLLLGSNVITHIDGAVLGQLPQLQGLDLTQNPLGQQPQPPEVMGAALANASGLIALQLAFCQLTAAPTPLGSAATPLQLLNLSGNALTTLAPLDEVAVPTIFLGLGPANGLVFDVSSNSLTSLARGKFAPFSTLSPADMAALNNQAIFAFDYNAITSLPADLLTFAVYAGSAVSASVSFTHNQITALPPGVFSIPGLIFATVDLRFNLIADIAPGCMDPLDYDFDISSVLGSSQYLSGTASGVSTVLLAHNRLTTITTGMFSNLRVTNQLDLSSNQIHTIEQGAFTQTFAIANLFGWLLYTETEGVGFSTLQMRLDLSNNSLTELPLSRLVSIPLSIFIVLSRLDELGAPTPDVRLTSCCDASWLQPPTANVLFVPNSVLCLQQGPKPAFVPVETLSSPPCPCFNASLWENPSNVSGFCDNMGSLTRLPSDEGCSNTSTCPPGYRREPVNDYGGWETCISPTTYSTTPTTFLLRHMICRECDVPHCKACDASVNNCDACFAPYLVANGTCVEDCGPGNFVTNSSNIIERGTLCQPCPVDQCYSCTANPRQCQICRPGMLLLAGSCLASCPSGYGAVHFTLPVATDTWVETGECRQCQVSGCAQCDGAGGLAQCTACSFGLLLLDNNKCVTACPAGYTKSTSPINGAAVCEQVRATSGSGGSGGGVSVGAIAGGVAAAVVLLAIMALYMHFHRKRFGEIETELTAKLLDSEDRVERLRRVWEIDESDVTLQGRLAAGAQGEVWLGRFRGIEVGVKVLHQHFAEMADTADFDAEVDALTQLRHRNLVLFYGAGTFSGGDGQPADGAAHGLGGSRFLVVEYMARGGLDVIIANSPRIELQTKLGFLRDAARGLQYIHSLHHIHRDVKTANLLVGTDWTVKVADFGTSKLQQTLAQGQARGAGSRKRPRWLSAASSESAGSGGGTYASTAIDAVSVPGALEDGAVGRQGDSGRGEDRRGKDGSGSPVNPFLTKGVGTPLYMAPEILQGRGNYGREVDVFSYAICMWEVMEQQEPWQDIAGGSFFMGRLLTAIEGGQRPPIHAESKGWPPGLCRLVDACWQLEPAHRPSFDAIVEALDGDL